MKVLWVSITFVCVSLLFNGSLLAIYSLHRDQARLLEQVRLIKTQSAKLDKELTMAKDPAYIERQARDRYDLADENDLVFVFSDE